MIFNTLQVNTWLPYHYRLDSDYEALLAEIERENHAKKSAKKGINPTAVVKVHVSTLESYLCQTNNLSQFLPEQDNDKDMSKFIDLTTDADPIVVVEKLLEEANTAYNVMVITVHFNSILLFYTAFLMFFSILMFVIREWYGMHWSVRRTKQQRSFHHLSLQ